MRPASRLGKPIAPIPARGEAPRPEPLVPDTGGPSRPGGQRGGDLALIARAAVAVVVVTAALARHLAAAAVRAVRAAFGRTRPLEPPAPPLEETVARAIRSLL